MNEHFLSKFREAPPAEFTESLYINLMQGTKVGRVIRKYSTVRRIVFALTLICVTFAIVMTVSPTLRAAALAAVDDIVAKITVRGTTVLVSDGPLPVPTGERETYSVIWRPASPDEITANYPFFAKLPTWLPSDYKLQERASLYYLSVFEEPSSALFEWKDNAGETIQLDVMKGSCLNGPPSPEAAYSTSDCTLQAYISVGLENEPQVSAINGQPAVFFRGVMALADLSGPVQKWNPSRWKPNKDISSGRWAIWENDGRTFVLVAGSATITREELIRVAESIP